MTEIYIDPSYSSTGITVIQKGEIPSVSFFNVKGQGLTMRTYPKYFGNALFVVDKIADVLKAFLPGSTAYVESPPPWGFTAAGLYGLSFLLVDRLIKSDVSSIYHINPGAVKRFCKQREVQNQKLRYLVAEIYFQKTRDKFQSIEGEELLRSKKQNDVATSFLFYVMRKLEYGKIELVWRGETNGEDTEG